MTRTPASLVTPPHPRGDRCHRLAGHFAETVLEPGVDGEGDPPDRDLGQTLNRRRDRFHHQDVAETDEKGAGHQVSERDEWRRNESRRHEQGQRRDCRLQIAPTASRATAEAIQPPTPMTRAAAVPAAIDCAAMFTLAIGRM